jgi:hypothetical protein
MTNVGPGVKGIAMFDENGHYSWQIIAANRPKSESTSPRTNESTVV